MASANLKSRRLTVRPLTEGDAQGLFEAVESSRESLKRRLLWVGDIRRAEDQKGFINDAIAAAERGDELTWGVFETKMNALVGVVSLDKESSKERTKARFAVWIRFDKQDRGYCTEVGKVVLECGFRRLNCHRLFARIDPTNRAFRRVLKKLGFHYEGCLRDDKRLNGRWIDQECWGLLKAEWKK